MIYQGYVKLTTYNKKGQIINRSTFHNEGTENLFELLYTMLTSNNVQWGQLPHRVQMFGLKFKENSTTEYEIDFTSDPILIEPAQVKSRVVKSFGLDTSKKCASFTFLLDSLNVQDISDRKVWNANTCALVLCPKIEDGFDYEAKYLASIIPTEAIDLESGNIISVEWQMIFTNNITLNYTESAETNDSLTNATLATNNLTKTLDLQDSGNLQILENNENEGEQE